MPNMKRLRKLQNNGLNKTIIIIVVNKISSLDRLSFFCSFKMLIMDNSL